MLGPFGAVWGIAGVILLLGYAVMRLIPIVIDGFAYDLQWYHWLVLVLNTAQMAYLEGYRGFQKGFSPRLAARAKYLNDQPDLVHALLAPLFCLGYFHTSKRRQTVVFSLTLGIVLLIILVHQLDQPWRGIIDAGVVVGLSWGLISLLIFAVQAFASKEFDYSPDVPAAMPAAGDPVKKLAAHE